MEEIYQKLSHKHFHLWVEETFDKNETCEVTELWLHHDSNTIVPKDNTVLVTGLMSWLDTATRGVGSEAHTLVARFIWITIDGTKLSLSKSIQKLLISRFGLTTANAYSRSCVTGINAFPPTPPTAAWPAEHRAYSLSYAPKLAAIWSHSRFRPPMAQQSVTDCIMFACLNQKKQLRGYLNQAPWRPEISSLAMFPAFMISIMLGSEINQTQEDIKKELRVVENRTGFHNFQSRAKKAVAVKTEGSSSELDGSELEAEELGEVSAKTSGYASKLASAVRKSKTLEKLLVFTVRLLDEESGKSPSGQTGRDQLKSHVAVLKERLEFQMLDADYTSKRIQIQIDALYNLITQSDSTANIRLAQSNAKIAFFSYQDSSSMKTLAVVTMFFLPGSFVSALFSTNCFDWDRVDKTAQSNIGVPSTPQHKLYWAITIPVTVITFVLYFLWLYFNNTSLTKKFEQEQRASDAKEKALRDETESHRAARERKETTLEKQGTWVA